MNNIFNDLKEKINIEAEAEYDNDLSSMSESVVGVRAFREGSEFIINSIQTEYDKLCAKPKQFGQSDYVAINPTNVAYSYLENPKIIKREWNARAYRLLGQINIPFGLDWRLCCWSIDDAKRIHGE